MSLEVGECAIAVRVAGEARRRLVRVARFDLIALEDRLYPAAGEVSRPARKAQPIGFVGARLAEPDALHLAAYYRV